MLVKYKYNKKESHGYSRNRTRTIFELVETIGDKVRLKAKGNTGVVWHETAHKDEVKELF